MHVDSLIGQDLQHGVRDVLIFARDKSWSCFENRHFAAEAAKHLPELETDVTSADNQQMPRKFGQIHHRAVGQIRYLIEPANVRDDGSPADVDKYAGRGESLFANRNLVRGFELRVAAIHGRGAFYPV